MKYIVVYRDDPTGLLALWIFVIVLVALIGALMRKPPETLYQRYNYDSSKLQYITIGGSTTQHVKC